MTLSRRLIEVLGAGRAWALSMCVVLLSCTASLAAAQSEAAERDRQATQIYQQVMSPFCPGRSLNDCPSSKAHDLKEHIRAQLEAGVPVEKILEDTFKEYGDQYRAVPRYQGFGRIAWWAPVAFVLAGLLLALGVVVKRNRSAAVVAGSVQEPLTDDVRRRIEEELGRLE